MTTTKVDESFLSFVMQNKQKKKNNEGKSKQHIGKENATKIEDLDSSHSNYKIRLLDQLNLKSQAIKEIDIVQLDVKLNDNNKNDGSLKDLLSKMQGQVLTREIAKESKHTNDDNSDKESSDEESDYEEEKVNHYVNQKRNKKSIDKGDDISEEDEAQFSEEEDEEGTMTKDKKEKTKGPVNIECEIFAENIPVNKHEKEIIKFFRNLSPKIFRVKVLRNKTKAFLKFTSKQDAESLINKGIKYDNSKIKMTLVDSKGEGNKVSKDQSREDNKKNENKFAKSFNANQVNNSHTAFVRNLPVSITDELLTKNFKQFGKITNIRLMKSKEGKPKGFGYIDFKSAVALNKALNESIMTPIVLEGKQLVVEKAKSSFNADLLEDTKRLGKKKKRSTDNNY